MNVHRHLCFSMLYAIISVIPSLDAFALAGLASEKPRLKSLDIQRNSVEVTSNPTHTDKKVNSGMKVQQLALTQFTAFDKAEFNFCTGINVFIGANSTGKSHVMKAIYTLLKACEAAQLDLIASREAIEGRLKEKLMGVFKPDNVGRLIRRKQGRNTGFVDLIYDGTKLSLTLGPRNSVSLNRKRLPRPKPSIYLPAHEFLSIYEGFISAYQHRETAFDETYYDLSLALNRSPLRGPRLDEVRKLITPLEKAIGGVVTQENGRFYVRLPEGKLEAHLVAEGYRKFAGLIYLLSNGSLTENGILYWDEPEANLNPELITVVVEVLRILAASGVQVFVATHDYLLSQELSLLAEYPSDTVIKFFALHKPNRRASVVVESGDTLADIENNPILDEFAAHYDREAALFQKTQ